MQVDEFHELVAQRRETRSLEFKQSATWDALKFKIIKAALALSNIRDGGHLVIGFNEVNNSEFEPVGMTESDLLTYNSDQIKRAISKYADPYVSIEIHRISDEGKQFLVMQVDEFPEIPVICKYDGDKIYQGRIYTRTRRMPESAEIPSQTEMREILDIAAEKKLRSYLEMQRRASIPQHNIGNDENKFLDERKDLP